MHIIGYCQFSRLTDDSMYKPLHSIYSKTLYIVKHNNTTVGNQNGSFRRKYAFPVPFGGRNGSSRRKMVGEKFETGDRSLTDR